ncbi:MAG TPA: hypothetical protein VGK02_07620 [Candidatus Aquicultor sp.]|jgi:hypothetical protein
MIPQNISPGKSALIMFLASFFLGLAIFVIFGRFAGVFSGNKSFVVALTGSPYGWVALFGGAMIVASPIIALSIWAFDKAVKATLENAKNTKKKR